MRSILQFFKRRSVTAKLDGPDASLPLPTLSKTEQFALLEAHMLGTKDSHQLCDLVSKHLGDKRGEAYRLFSISKEEYLAWARSLPVNVFVDTEPSPRDGRYLLQESSSWVVIDQERGHAWHMVSFPTQEEALDYLYKDMSPYWIYPHLRDDESSDP